jgi:hypothetical protein
VVALLPRDESADRSAGECCYHRWCRASGGIGRRAGFRFLSGQPGGGSSPLSPTLAFAGVTYDVHVGKVLSKEQLEAAHCWEADDRVPQRPEMTEFRRQLRYHQSQWREAQGHPIGSQPIAPKPGGGSVRLIGSRLPLAYARETGANFLTAGALDAAKARTSAKEPHQSFDQQRLWADLLWSTTMAFNLFGDLAADLGLADRAVHTWWPDAPGRVSAVRFEHSPGWLDPAYIGNLSSFDAAILLDLGDETQGIVALKTKYHDRTKPETPKPRNLRRYREVAERSGVFEAGAIDAVKGRTDLAVMWLEHLLLLSMLRHASGTWSWGRYVVVHAAGNSDFADACARYRALLADQSTFSSMTVEELLDADVLRARTATALRRRSIPR